MNLKRRLVTVFLLLSLVINIVLAGVILKDSDSKTKVSYYISGYKGNPEEELINVINSTKTELSIAIYNLDNKKIADAISTAAERGVSVRIIADGDKTEKKASKKIFNELEKLKIPIKIDKNEKMHMKLTISDNHTVVIGSFNYTKKSAENNKEILLTIKDPDLALSMNETLNELWNGNSLETW